MEHDGSTQLAAFRDQARAWLAVNFPESLAGRDDEPLAPYGEATPSADQELWRQRMAEKGWSVPTWPAAYGGGGLTAAEAGVLREEMQRVGALNPIGGMGVWMFGPTLLEYGTEAQKQRYIPDIVAGKVWWCQGYSEPGAGSDLASLQTRAEDKGDHFLVNGQKIWTSGAQYADMIFCLVRTDPTRKQEGISFVVFSMRQPGVEVRPILLIAGHSPFCETFITNVQVPKQNLIGSLNGGWSVAKRLLQFERSPSADEGADPPELGVLAKHYLGEDSNGRLADSDMRMRIAANAIEQRAVQLTNLRVAAEARSNAGPSAASSILKNANAAAEQDRAELLVEAMGARGLGWDGEDYAEDERTAVRAWLAGKAASIYSGSHEIQNNIISKRLLGLPDSTAAR
ncbi:MAG TPA: acyl-CoA dehydrogenase family protein [Caulobacteraceae bacterium]|nr:acyl-CoA dehydrogenase family protein [Caulobacteraceae bacterium]